MTLPDALQRGETGVWACLRESEEVWAWSSKPKNCKQRVVFFGLRAAEDFILRQGPGGERGCVGLILLGSSKSMN